MLVRLGIADQVKPKMKYAAGGPGGLVGTLVAKGEAEIGLQQVSELMAAPGVDIVGSLPAVLETATNSPPGSRPMQSSRGRQGAGDVPHHARSRGGDQGERTGTKLIGA